MSESENNKKNTKRRRIVGILTTALLVLSVVICLTVSIQVLGKGYASFGKYSFFRVVTGSMEPEILVGDLIMTKKVDINELKVGDVITFSSKSPTTIGKIITHRIIDITVSENGNVLLQTKGDANLVADGYYVDSSNLIGRVSGILGNANVFSQIISFFSSKSGFVVCILLPTMLVAGIMMQSSVMKLKNDMSKLVTELAEQDNKAATLPADKKTESTDIRLNEEKDSVSAVDMSDEEYQQMCDAIREELIEELKEELIKGGEKE